MQENLENAVFTHTSWKGRLAETTGGRIDESDVLNKQAQPDDEAVGSVTTFIKALEFTNSKTRVLLIVTYY
jgi:hypothetical protein